MQFPKAYTPPKLQMLTDSSQATWGAACTNGTAPDGGASQCSWGNSATGCVGTGTTDSAGCSSGVIPT